jgi:hypothetical protein
MLLEVLRSKRNAGPRQQEVRLRVEELSARLMLSGDGTIEPPCPPPPGTVEVGELSLNP